MFKRGHLIVPGENSASHPDRGSPGCGLFSVLFDVSGGGTVFDDILMSIQPEPHFQKSLRDKENT